MRAGCRFGPDLAAPYVIIPSQCVADNDYTE